VTTIDCRGQRCPLPVIALARNIRDVAIGETLTVLADDPAAANDIAAWCRMKGQELVESGATSFTVRRLS
jgi:tRNA 2-thiouridine synthesizing protein A